MFVHISMLTQVYELFITLLHIFSINFVNFLSYYRCIRYFPVNMPIWVPYTLLAGLVFPALFRVSVWYLLNIRVLHLSQNIVKI